MERKIAAATLGMSSHAALKRLLKPQTVAVFGGDDAAEVIGQCRAVGFAGEIWAVSPNRRDLGGVACVNSVAQLPGVPDASFVAAPPSASVDIVRDLSARGAGGAVCFAAGFAETGVAGARLQDQLRAAAGDMAIIGPNCHGFLNYLDGVALWPDHHGCQRVERGVALVLQSGNLGINLSMQKRSLDIGYVITIGNNSCLGFHDYIDTLLDDPRVTAIGLHIEGIDDVHTFSRAAIKALRAGVPIVAMKTGSSPNGAELAMSHTASLAGSDELYSALFNRLGIARCHTLAEFLETLKFLSVVGALPGNTLGSLSCSGGEASIIADCAERMRIETPPLSAESAGELQDMLGSRVHISNPLDYHTYAWGVYEKLNAAFRAMLGNAFACTMLVLDYPTGPPSATENWKIAERALIDATATSKQRAVIVSTLPETLPADVRERLLSAGIAPMQGIEECLFAIRAAVAIGRAQRDADNILAVTRAPSASTPLTALDECESKAELAAFGLNIPAGRLCTASETVAAARQLGFPVALKAVSDTLAHKSEAGAVAVNLLDDSDVHEATQAMMPRYNRFLVEEMAGPGIAELIIGVSRDRTFGLTILLGAGGTLAELLGDGVFLLLPVRRREIVAALKSMKIAKIIDGYRGGVAGDFEAVVDAVEIVAAYAQANSASLEELDVNPLIVMPQGAIAVDAFIRKRAGSA